MTSSGVATKLRGQPYRTLLTSRAALIQLRRRYPAKTLRTAVSVDRGTQRRVRRAGVTWLIAPDHVQQSSRFVTRDNYNLGTLLVLSTVSSVQSVHDAVPAKSYASPQVTLPLQPGRRIVVVVVDRLQTGTRHLIVPHGSAV